MPHLETWKKLPPAIRQHLMDRMRDRRISIADLNKLRIWVESHPHVPEGEGVDSLLSFKSFFFLEGVKGKPLSF